MRKGLFISFEGPDGSGKSTQIAKLRTKLEKMELPVFLTREPGGSLIGEKIRELILDPAHEEMNDLTEALLYAASRAQHVAQVIKPALAEGKVVLCDRFMDSSIAYQGYGRKLGDRVRIINEIAVDGLVPDLTFLLLIEPGEGKKRISHGPLDRLEREELEYHNDVYEGYMALLEKNRQRMRVIDGSGSISAVEEEILEKTLEFLRQREFLK